MRSRFLIKFGKPNPRKEKKATLTVMEKISQRRVRTNLS